MNIRINEKGGFDLIRTSQTEQKAWLLIKRDDEYASSEDIVRNDRSVKSGKSVEEIGVYDIERPVSPMKAILANEPFDDKDWIFEIKWDGYRAIAEVENGEVKLYSRNNISYDILFAPIVDSLKKFKQNLILDGEIVVLDEKGRADFQLLQNYKATKKGNLTYYVFDILYLDGRDLTGMKLEDRKKILEKVLKPSPKNIKLSEYINEKGIDFYKAVREQQIEGIIAKKRSSVYETGRRSSGWIKIKARNRQEAIICGLTKPRGGRKLFGALVLGLYENEKLTYVGHTGGGFNDASLSEVWNKMKLLVQGESPFDKAPKTNMPVSWIKPELVCEVEFSEWTKDGVMRMPVFLGLREDKNPNEVVREIPEKIQKEEKKFNNLSFTNLKKVFFPEDKITKNDLISYYEEISIFILPHLKDRPESLLRFPDGINGQSFFHKDMKGEQPRFVKTIKIRSDIENRDIEYLICQDKVTLLYMIQLGCVDINPWFSTINHLENPTYCVLDLDPLKIGFTEVIETALEVHKVLDEIKVPNFCKTSGATGLHVYIPLGSKYSYEQSRIFAELIANIVRKRIPKITSIWRIPSKRKKKVYIDFLQNRIGQTLAAPYSVRPRPKAPVSTPLEWHEVNEKLIPEQFSIKNIGKRLEEKGDLFKKVLGEGIDLKKAIENLELLR